MGKKNDLNSRLKLKLVKTCHIEFVEKILWM